MENTAIEWATHTFNPWRGCTKVSAGCKNCYAETLSHQNPKILGQWGPNGTRVVASESKWAEPVKWSAVAESAEAFLPGQQRPRVFCASLADVFESWDGPMTAANGNPMWWCHGSMSNSPLPSTGLPDGCRMVTMDDIRERLLFLIRDTPELDWLLLTKRPENILSTFARLDACDIAETFPNLWLGASVENQAAADERIPHLLRTPAAVRFLSCEPLLGPVFLEKYFYHRNREARTRRIAIRGYAVTGDGRLDPPGVDWVIVGGESGPGARPMQVEWARSLVAQCEAAGVPCFVKQDSGSKPGRQGRIPLDVWQHKEFPTVTT